MLARVNPAQKGVTLAWIAVILLAALVPFAPPLLLHADTRRSRRKAVVLFLRVSG
jgi:hypothetical protein